MRRLRIPLAALLLLSASLLVLAGPDQVCPVCGALLDPDAVFCSACGRRVSGGPTNDASPRAAHDARTSVVQVVAVHDKRLTSTFGAIAFGENVEVPSIVGSAFAIAPGEFVTDAGLLAGAKTITLKTAAGRTVTARAIGTDPMIGVGLLAADLPETPPLKLRTAELRLGESLSAFGYPAVRRAAQGDVATLAGVVSGLHRGDLRIHPIEDYMQTDATLPEGFAGGPVVDSTGRVAGMSTGLPIARQILLGPAGLGMSIPAAWVDRALTWIRAGSPPRAWIGIHTVSADAGALKTYGLPGDVGRVIESVFPGSPAAAALRRGDGFLRAQGEDAASLVGIHEKLLGARPGDSWKLEVARGKERLTFNVTLAERPERPRLEALDTLRLYGGFEVAPRGPATLAVSRVFPASEASDAKIVLGDLLQSVLSKKDLEHAHRDNARWRTVRDLKDLGDLVLSAHSEFDFFIGLRFRSRDGTKRELYLWDLLTPTSAL